NDCWPVISWAAVDSEERLKPRWYALRSAFATHRLSVQPHENGLVLAGVNDATKDWQVAATVRRVGFDGTEHARAALDLEVPVAGVAQAQLPAHVATPDDQIGRASCRERGWSGVGAGRDARKRRGK